MDELITTKVEREANIVKLSVNIPRHTTFENVWFEDKSSKIVLNRFLNIQFKTESLRLQQIRGRIVNSTVIFLALLKTKYNNYTTYEIELSSPELGIHNKIFRDHDDSWQYICKSDYHTDNDSISITMTVKCKTVLSPNHCLASLHDDTELTDFQLKGEDGTVEVHKAVLAACSPVLRRMLSGPWREGKAGLVNVPGTSRATLQHLKDYLYTDSLPDTGLEHLILLASYYMMPELEQRATLKLMDHLTAENTYDLLNFANIHKLFGLYLSILHCIQFGVIKVEEMEKLLVLNLRDENEGRAGEIW